jgi:hypothetical protein
MQTSTSCSQILCGSTAVVRCQARLDRIALTNVEPVVLAVGDEDAEGERSLHVTVQSFVWSLFNKALNAVSKQSLIH